MTKGGSIWTLPKPTPNANQRKGQTQPPQTRNSQSQRRHKWPNRNQAQTLDPSRKHSIVLTGGPPRRPRVQVFRIGCGNSSLTSVTEINDFHNRTTRPDNQATSRELVLLKIEIPIRMWVTSTVDYYLYGDSRGRFMRKFPNQKTRIAPHAKSTNGANCANLNSPR